MSKGLNFTNFLLIGYTAWKGFSKVGRGVVFCQIKKVDLPHVTVIMVPEKHQTVDEVVSTHFLAKAELIAYLHEWMVEKEIITSIFQAVDSYNPRQDMIILAKEGSQIEVDILQKPVITPIECYQQVRQRWDEFSGYISQIKI
ncbi:hypothetical protein [Calothrix sp. NIES-3974]|uniref:hypothetical protein n=1 Tax=Calothrix sp. NIES-3974 TaxID=2005462 RepID=UPI000B61727E|nr:hypothetical protein [Calothrix sp. NIES-3974]BAZ06401.1 hypothetical protein NIES3974_30620 [Calothrix sp. NIES-3974]